MNRIRRKRRDRFYLLLAGLALALLVGAGSLVQAGSPAPAPQAVLLPTPPIAIDTPLARVTDPVDLTHAGDERLFIAERAGRIKIVDAGGLRPVPFLDISDLVITQEAEQGLLGLAFDPHYRENGYFYVHYTDLAGQNQIVRYTRSPGDPNLADPQSAFTILTIPATVHPYHYGGQLAFGPDGDLYISVGDGGLDPAAQDRRLWYGKLLRLDVDGAVPPTPYVVPTTNPFYGEAGARWEIWQLGFRHPWRFSFDRATGDLFIADVGENSWEEVDFAPASSPGGEDYGWPLWEGRHCYEPPSNCTPTPGATPYYPFVTPIAEYAHNGGRCAAMGGYVYRGLQSPELQGIYFFADYCSGQLWSLQRVGPDEWQMDRLVATDPGITSFGQDVHGELYLVGATGIRHIRQVLPGVNRPQAYLPLLSNQEDNGCCAGR